MDPVKGKRWKALDRHNYDLRETCHGARPEEEQERYEEDVVLRNQCLVLISLLVI